MIAAIKVAGDKIYIGGNWDNSVIASPSFCRVDVASYTLDSDYTSGFSLGQLVSDIDVLPSGNVVLGVDVYQGYGALPYTFDGSALTLGSAIQTAPSGTYEGSPVPSASAIINFQCQNATVNAGGFTLGVTNVKAAMLAEAVLIPLVADVASARLAAIFELYDASGKKFDSYTNDSEASANNSSEAKQNPPFMHLFVGSATQVSTKPKQDVPHGTYFLGSQFRNGQCKVVIKVKGTIPAGHVRAFSSANNADQDGSPKGLDVSVSGNGALTITIPFTVQAA